MYHLTTSTGLTQDAETPTGVSELLRTELLAHLAAGPVSWSITDELPGQHAGRIQVTATDRAGAATVGEYVEELWTNLTLEQADAARRQVLRGEQTMADGRLEGWNQD